LKIINQLLSRDFRKDFLPVREEDGRTFCGWDQQNNFTII